MENRVENGAARVCLETDLPRFPHHPPQSCGREAGVVVLGGRESFPRLDPVILPGSLEKRE